MISVVKVNKQNKQAYDNKSNNKIVVKLQGLSTDDKPFSYANGSLLFCMDTNQTYIFDEENMRWILWGGN